jgi:hypothetical protein
VCLGLSLSLSLQTTNKKRRRISGGVVVMAAAAAAVHMHINIQLDRDALEVVARVSDSLGVRALSPGQPVHAARASEAQLALRRQHGWQRRGISASDEHGRIKIWHLRDDHHHVCRSRVECLLIGGDRGGPAAQCTRSRRRRCFRSSFRGGRRRPWRG